MKPSAWYFAAGLLFLSLLPLQAQNVTPVPKYAAAIRVLEEWIAEEVETKKLPALSIALVDDQQIIWSRGFGFEDPKAKKLASADTVYRVGSVSKPFTALLLMLLVEMGLIDLDAPIQTYLPDFQPVNKTGKQITLRQMLCHRSGIVRESPVGNYFDDTDPSLAETVKSLNKTEMVYTPETKTSYSNAALATVGHVIEHTQKKPFAKLMQEKILDPLGMTHSSFERTPVVRKNLAKALMWTYHGREFDAPPFDLGMSPAGNLYSSVNDLGRFCSFLFSRGMGPKGRVLKAETLERMWKVQLDPKAKEGFGLGFYVSEFEGRRQISHGGAVYGFSTEFAALPDDKLGAIVVCSRDVSNSVTQRIARMALRYMIATKEGKPLPPIQKTTPLSPEDARRLAGHYVADQVTLDLLESGGRLWILLGRGGAKHELRRSGDKIMIDDPQAFGLEMTVEGDTLKTTKLTYKRADVPRPDDVPEKWKGLIGEYGPDHNTLYILERDGKLNALIEWLFLYPLTEVTPDVYKFPDFGLYHGDKIVFERGPDGKATLAIAASVPFKRRHLLGERGTFRIDPIRPIQQLRKAALAASPPEEKNVFQRKPDLVELTSLDTTIKLDIRYASTNNFLGTPFYTSAKAFLQKPAAEALLRAHKKLQDKGFGLLIHDAYRPWFVTKMFWDATPERYRLFVADPTKGSRHNRGCAVDLTLYDLKTGQAVDMPGLYDEFSDRSYPDYLGGTSRQRWRRDLLRRTMEGEGFTVYEAEWWHFDYRDWRQYPILNETFEKLVAR